MLMLTAMIGSSIRLSLHQLADPLCGMVSVNFQLTFNGCIFSFGNIRIFSFSCRRSGLFGLQRLLLPGNLRAVIRRIHQFK